MDRRAMLKAAGLVGAAAGFTRSAELGAVRPEGGADDAPAIEDILIVDGLDPSGLNPGYLAKLKTARVNCWHKTIAGLGVDEVRAFGGVLAFADEHPDDLVVVTTVQGIRAAAAQGKIGLVLGAQSAEFVAKVAGVDDLASSRTGTLAESIRVALRGYYALGLRILGIAYNLPNSFGSGCLYPYIGLTAAGRALVEEIHRRRILLDLGGHTGEQTSLDAIAMAPEMPVICSHGNVAGIVDNPRCVSDRLIEAIARTGGVVGVSAISDFHVRGRNQLDVAQSRRAVLEDHLDQFDYLKKLVGVDHIGLGPDFTEGQGTDAALWAGPWVLPYYLGPGGINRAVKSDGAWTWVKGFETITDLPNVTQGLERRGWPRADVAKVMGGNWLRVYQAAWGG